MTAIWVEVIETKGSAPRDAGTAMKVMQNITEGTIGGGALEFEAIRIARKMIDSDQNDVCRTFPLGPDLGQCCGGAVTLHFTTSPCVTDCMVQPALPQSFGNKGRLWLWGAGHVGRAVIAALPPGAFDITWIDDKIERFPDVMPSHVKALPAASMPVLAARAPLQAHHLVFTYSHEIDLALCAALLARSPTSLGLIGSDTKKARFFKRLRTAGLDPTPITCPIGDKRLGKAPAAIAAGVAQALLSDTEVAA